MVSLAVAATFLPLCQPRCHRQPVLVRTLSCTSVCCRTLLRAEPRLGCPAARPHLPQGSDCPPFPTAHHSRVSAIPKGPLLAPRLSALPWEVVRHLAGVQGAVGSPRQQCPAAARCTQSCCLAGSPAPWPANSTCLQLRQTGTRWVQAASWLVSGAPPQQASRGCRA